MTSPEETVAGLLGPILDAPRKGRRKLVAVVGPPASGKTTLARVLAECLTAAGCATSVVPMDGFHLDNRILSRLGLMDRKGAPQTFDVEGVVRLCRALPDANRVFYPTFDRDEDFARAGAGMVDASCDCVVVEGNYLLLDAPHWKDLAGLWDVSVRLDVPTEVLRQRLVQRWLDFGLPRDQAERRATGNDLVNAALIARHMLPSSITVGPTDLQ